MRAKTAGTPFVGRARELAELEDALARGERLITVTGPFGIGKSRLVAELAARVARGESALGEVEVIACELGDAASPEALVDAVASSVGAGPGGETRSRSAPDRAWPGRALVARGAALLVLDPFDRLVASADTLLGWLDAAPELAIVVVSRLRLRAAGEVVLELGPIEGEGGADAIELFASAVRAQRHDYAPGEAERKIAAEIVRELDGVPLALELAASRMAVMGAAALQHRLRSRFEILRRPSASGDRHSALEASLAWSWEILEAWEREALAQCTVFRGGFGLDAAESVIALAAPGAPAVIDVIESLRAKSLLRAADAPGVEGELRLSLYESVRAFAARGLAEGARELETRHAKYFVESAEAWAARVEARDGEDARARLLLERENLLAVVERILGRGTVSARIAELALRALVALAPVLSLRGPLETYARHMERALEVTAGSGADPRLQARGLLVRGSLRRDRGDLAGAERDLGEALVLAHHTGDARVEARALLAIARVAAQRGDRARAMLGVDKAAALAASAGDAGGEARAHLARATGRMASGDLAAARAELDRALLQARALRSAVAEAPIRRRLALLELHEGRSADARAEAEASRELAEALADRRGAAIARALGGLADHLDGDVDRAAAEYGTAIAELAAGGFASLEAIVSGLLGIAHAERGDRGEARLLVQAARASLEGGDAGLEAFFSCVLARIEAIAGREQSARALIASARARAASAGDPGLGALVEALEASLGRAEGSEGAAEGPAPGSLAIALIARLRDRGPRSTPPRAIDDEGALRVGAGGAWFRAPGGERVDLTRRKPLRLLLDRLAEERVRAPGSALAWDALIAAGWPGEKMRADAGAHRVRVAISTLRKLGLREAIRTEEDGYLIAADVAVVRD